MSEIKKNKQLAAKGYLNPKYYELFIGYVEVNELKKSEGVKIIVRNFFDKMSEDEKCRYRSSNHY